MDDQFTESGVTHGDSVLDWLDEIAAAEGLSREAAIQYLLSSYRRLEEVVELLEAGEGRSPIRDPAPADDIPALSEIDRLNERFDSLLDDVRARGERGDDRVDLHAGLVELSDRLKRLEEAPDADSGGQAAAVDDRDDAVRELPSRLDSLEGDLTAVEDRVDALAESAVADEELDAIVEQTCVFQDSISRRQGGLRDRVLTEFDHIRTVLEHLVETTAANERRTDRLDESVSQALRSQLADRERLAAITRTANRQGVNRATCANCGTDVDLGMLHAPVCPNCDRTVTDLETSRGLFGLFSSPVLTVSGAADRRNQE